MIVKPNFFHQVFFSWTNFLAWAATDAALSFYSLKILLIGFVASVFSNLFAPVVLVPKNWCKRSLLLRLLMSTKIRLKPIKPKQVILRCKLKQYFYSVWLLKETYNHSAVSICHLFLVKANYRTGQSITTANTVHCWSRFAVRNDKKLFLTSYWFGKKGPLKVLNGTKLILDYHRNNLDSLRISLESFRSFRGPLIHKSVTGQ